MSTFNLNKGNKSQLQVRAGTRPAATWPRNYNVVAAPRLSSDSAAVSGTDLDILSRDPSVTEPSIGGTFSHLSPRSPGPTPRHPAAAAGAPRHAVSPFTALHRPRVSAADSAATPRAAAAAAHAVPSSPLGPAAFSPAVAAASAAATAHGAAPDADAGLSSPRNALQPANDWAPFSAAEAPAAPTPSAAATDAAAAAQAAAPHAAAAAAATRAADADGVVDCTLKHWTPTLATVTDADASEAEASASLPLLDTLHLALQDASVVSDSGSLAWCAAPLCVCFSEATIEAANPVLDAAANVHCSGLLLFVAGTSTLFVFVCTICSLAQCASMRAEQAALLC